jgi:hypothetical protein
LGHEKTRELIGKFAMAGFVSGNALPSALKKLCKVGQARQLKRARA